MKKSSYRIIKETETFTGKENYFVEWKFLFFWFRVYEYHRETDTSYTLSFPTKSKAEEYIREVTQKVIVEVCNT